MSRFEWLSEYLARLEDEHVVVRAGSAQAVAPAHCLDLDPEDWGCAARVAAGLGCRWAGLWGDSRADTLAVYACLEYRGDYLLLRTVVALRTPILASHTPYFPAADRLERHTQDMLGIAFLDHPDHRRWTRHQAWADHQYPLRVDFPVAAAHSDRTPPDRDYPCHSVAGSGLYEIPVGPVHAGIIEPGHFRFQAVGEEILRLEERLGYVHKGIEKIAVGRDPLGLARLAARVSGDTTVAHTWAACQAMEGAAGCQVPPRALHLRALMAERERVANHLGDIGAICNDVGFTFIHYQCSRLRELWQRRSHAVFGHRLMMDGITPGGVTLDIEAAGAAALLADHATLRRETAKLFDIIDDYPSLQDRLVGAGRLDPDIARQLGTLGYVGKASGQGFDVRLNSPYRPYDGMEIKVPVFEEGDVAARISVRMNEIGISLDLLDRLLHTLPEGAVRTVLPELAADAEALGFVEGWRGEILTYVRFDAQGRIARFFPRDPSWFSWPALERLMLGNIVPDFPVCNKSVNGSYAGHDL